MLETIQGLPTPRLFMLTTLTRAQFDEACKAYAAAHVNERCDKVKTYPSSWTWNEHAVRGLNYHFDNP